MTSTEQHLNAECLTVKDARKLLAARASLKEIIERAERASWDAGDSLDVRHADAADYGRLAGVASVAVDQLFDVLNVAATYTKSKTAADAIAGYLAS